MRPRPVPHPPERELKFRQAAIVYLHYALLYAAGALALVERGLMPGARGPIWIWFLAGAAITAVVVWGLWWWQNVWFARVLWGVVTLRLPTLVEGAFFGGAIDVPRAVYWAAGLVVLVVLAALARAGWDL